MLTNTNITWGFVLLSPFIIPVLILLTVWFFVSKRKFNFLIAFTILSLLFVRYLRFPYDTVNRNSEIKISQNFLIKRTLSSDSEHEVYKLVDKTKPEDLILYLNGLAKINNTWIGYIEEIDSYEGKYGVKPETYFFINDNKIEYNLDEKTLEKRLGLKEIKLQDAEYFVDKFGSKKEILYQYQLDKTGDLDENISLNSKLSKKLEINYKKDRAFYLMFWSVMLLMEIIYLFIKNRKITKSNKD
ncbi:endonuclease [Leptotrichia trevisanii]|uniref:endonuclease n=1 Tax=Leptotrichia trevisanii TaxID=109328 RepID=UPI0026EC63E4|nr:endonuclease [Leptotrichia trevisanii]